MIAPMTAERAGKIAEWTYGGEYAAYDFPGCDEDIRELMNGEYYAQIGASGEPEGYFCFGASARIPTAEDGAYPDGALDIGLGRRPDLCGRGGGAAFVRAGLEFAGAAFGAARFRLTVALFNARAIRAYEKAGFRRARSVTHRASGQAFLIMTLEPSENA